jgi:hypothetical protein
VGVLSAAVEVVAPVSSDGVPAYPTGLLSSIQGCGSGSVSRSGLDPDSIGSVDPDLEPNSESGSRSRRAKMTHKSRKIFKSSCFEVLDGLFCELRASSVT